VVLWLCQRGADVHAIKEDGWNDTALHYAAANGNLGSVQVLLAYGGAFYVKNSFGEGRLQALTCCKGKLRLV